MAADPQWLRSSLCEDLAEVDRARGRIPNTRAIEHVVDTDIRIWQAHMRETRPGFERKANKRPEDARHGIAKRTAKERGAHFEHRGQVADEAPPERCACGGATCTACKLRLRIAALIEPVPIKDRVPTKWGDHYQNCRHPKYAREVLAIWEWMKISPKARRLKERGELDAIVQRKLEDVADRSTGIIGLGGWR